MCFLDSLIKDDAVSEITRENKQPNTNPEVQKVPETKQEKVCVIEHHFKT